MSNADRRYTFDDPFAKLNQRITDLENLVRQVAGGPKLGIQDTQMDYSIPYWTMSAAGLGVNNWEDDAGGGGTPSLTMTTGSRVMVWAAWTADKYNQIMGSVATSDYRSATVVMGMAVDDQSPDALSAYSYSQVSIYNTTYAEIGVSSSWMTIFEDLEPGEHTFKLQYWCDDTNPTGNQFPKIGFQRILVVPLGWQ